MSQGPRRKVAKGWPRVGSSIIADFKYYFWELTLECGHVVHRRVRYKPEAQPIKWKRRRGFAAMHHPPSRDRIPPIQRHAFCEECKPEATP